MSAIAYRPNSETRQQLEELDALIQRMLGLPLGLEAEPTAPPPAAVRPLPTQDPAPLQPANTLTIRSIPTPHPADSRPPLIQAWRVEMPSPSLQATESTALPEAPWATAIEIVADPLPLPRFKLPPVVAVPLAVSPTPPPTPAHPMVFGSPMPTTIPRAIPAPPAPATVVPIGFSPPTLKPPTDLPVPWTLWPIIGLNRLVELLLFCLGPLGKALVKPLGRNLVGWLGVLMIFGAIGWGIADWWGVDWTR